MRLIDADVLMDDIFELMDESIEVIAWCPLPEPYKGVTE